MTGLGFNCDDICAEAISFYAMFPGKRFFRPGRGGRGGRGGQWPRDWGWEPAPVLQPVPVIDWEGIGRGIERGCRSNPYLGAQIIGGVIIIGAVVIIGGGLVLAS